MRYGTLLVVTCLTVAMAPSDADARRRFGPGAVFGMLTAPMRMLAPRMHSPRAYRHRGSRSYASNRSYGERPERVSRSPADAPVHVAAGTVAATAAVTPAAATKPAPAGFNAYEDMLGYALWPQDYASRFWSRGYSDIARSLIAPPAGTPRNDSAEAPKGAPGGAPAGEPASMCLPQAKDRAVAPLDRLEKTLALTDAQRLKLKDLRVAVETAVDRGQSACHDAPPSSPADQLKVMMDGLWAMRDAEILFRTPLDALYRSLTDEQKAKLAPADRTTGGPATGSQASQVCEHAANDMPVGDLTHMAQPSAQPSQRQTTPPSEQQRQSMEMLQGMVADLSKYLAEACPAETPSTPVARLDAAGNRVNAMLYAAMNLDPILNGSYQEQPGAPK
jgi:hypothetical protein